MPAPPTIAADPGNADALRAWDGDDGAYWADHEDLFDASVARYRSPFLDAAAIGPDDHVLDIGCGNGETTRDAARAALRGSALGVDLSSRMVGNARRRADQEGLGNARFLQADAQVHPFDPSAHSVAVSRTGAMFFVDPVAAFRNVGRALRPGGRLVLLVWQSLEGNHWLRDFARSLGGGRPMPPPPPDAPGPLSWADPARVDRILTGAGFTDVACHGVERPMYFGASADQAQAFVLGLGFARGLLGALDPADRPAATAALRDSIDAHVTDEGVLYPSAAWIVTARRTR